MEQQQNVPEVKKMIGFETYEMDSNRVIKNAKGEILKIYKYRNVEYVVLRNKDNKPVTKSVNKLFATNFPPIKVENVAINKNIKWVAINKYESYYKLSSDGEVMNKDGKILSQVNKGTENARVKLQKDGKESNKSVRKLLEEHFPENIVIIKDEKYKNITNYPIYKVSNLANVKNMDTGKILKPRKSRSGYYSVELTNTTGRKSFLIHRLVAETPS
jgi:hypothetical protein